MSEVNEIPQFGTWRRSVATFGAAGIVAVVGLASYTGINRARAARELVWHTRQVIETSFATLAAFQDAETGQRGFLLTGEESYLAPYQKALTTLATQRNVPVVQCEAANPHVDRVRVEVRLVRRSDVYAE